MYYLKSFPLIFAFLLGIVSSGKAEIAATGYKETSNIISNLHITGFAQDHSGVMWISTARGLCRYNGYEYIHYLHDGRHPNSMPSDFTSSVYLDREGNLWITTDNGVCRYNHLTDDFSTGIFEDESLKSSFEYACVEFQGQLLVCGLNGIKIIDRNTMLMTQHEATSAYVAQTMIEDDYYQLWMGGMVGQGIVCLNKDLTVLARIQLDDTMNIISSYKADNGDIWFGTNQGLIVVNPLSKEIVTDTFTPADFAVLSRLRIKFMRKVDDRTVLLGTENAGLFVYDTFANELSSSRAGDFFEDSYGHMTCCYTDREKNIWLGTFDRGYSTTSNLPDRFNNDKALNTQFGGKFVTRITEDGNGNLWVGTRYDGFIFYDSARGKAIEYNRFNFPPLAAANSNLIENIYIDSSGNLWVGYPGSVAKCRVDNGRIVSYRVFEHYGPSTFMEDDFRRLWIGSAVDGITVYDTQGVNKPQVIRPGSKWNNITCVIRQRSGEMLISAYDDGLYIADPNDMSVKRVEVPDKLAVMLDRVIHVFEDSKGNIWTGSYGKGAAMYNRRTGEYKLYSRSDGLPGNNVLAIAEDGKGDIWMSTSYGIVRFDSEKKIFTSFFDHDGTGGNQFHEKAVFMSRGGRIYFGGNHGLTYFDAGGIVPINKSIPVLLEDLKIMNVSAPIGGRNSVLQAHVSHTASITLNHRQNVFSIDYSGVDFSSSKNVKYAYRLRNFDNGWNYVGNYRRAGYSNLSPGRYVFEVMAQNQDGHWNEVPTTLEIKVKAAPWLSSWAIMSYILFAIFVTLLCLRIYINIKMNRERMGMMEKERELENEMSDLKIKFFTNISHELRTPLSMIYGPVKQLRTAYDDRALAGYLMDLINFNVDNLLRLIDQLMDFAKIESDTLSLSVSETDVRLTVGKLVESYSFYAGEKHIELNLNAQSDRLQTVAVDKDKISKIVSNLLSNALKYTPSGGHVRIDLDVTDNLPAGFEGLAGDHLVMTVTDDGVGIGKEDLKHLFKRYKRFATKDDYSKNVDGKGIGLNYVKRLVDKHNGRIVARQGEGGQGMVFTVAIPVDSSASQVEGLLAAAEFPVTADAGFKDVFANAHTSDEDRAGVDISEDRRTVLIVEDNPELRLFLKRIFSDDYNVVSASDGRQAVDMLADYDISIVISDVLMPRMSGLELCGYIKNDPAICHIPVVLLTAKAIVDDQVEGYSKGADLYVTKPFNPVLLKMLICNMFINLDRRSRLTLSDVRRLESGNLPAESGGSDDAFEMNPLDKRFMERLQSAIEQDISNCNLDINAIGKEMAFSRTSFYRKIKALTGESPYGFLRVYRLNKAVELLRTQEHTISEIVDLVGFGTHSHFSACFKKQFGVSPKNYTGGKRD